MKNLQLLDCTLRDGGYVNDWQFGHSTILGIYKRLEEAGVDVIEVGFLDDRRSFDINRTIMPNTQVLNEIFRPIKKKKAMPVAMIDYGTCSLDSVGPANETFIDGIRVIFKKEKIKEALPFCKAIKDKGYKLFIQAISITAYNDKEILDYVEQINEIRPYAFSIVDTYGLLDNKSMSRYFHLIDHNLDPEIKLGYHEHNNFQLGFSNTLKFLEKETTRTLIADSTVYGMGKSAGNCATELLAMHLNEYYGKDYKLNHLLEIIDTHLMPIYRKHYWGYKYDFFISSMQACHPNYVKYLLEKNTLSVSSVNSILSTIPSEKKLIYDQAWIEKAYSIHQNTQINDSEAYKKLTEKISKDVVVIGPGASVRENIKTIVSLLQENKYTVISINHKPDYSDIDILFISNSKRYSQIADGAYSKDNEAIMVTSNISPIDLQPDYTLNYESLLVSENECKDNALLLLLNVLAKIGVSSVKLIGMDGYSEGSFNYYTHDYSVRSPRGMEFNKRMAEEIKKFTTHFDIEFITPSKYSLI